MKKKSDQKATKKDVRKDVRIDGGAKGKEVKTEKKTPTKKQTQIEPTGKKLNIDSKHAVKTYERYPFEKMTVGDFFIEEEKGEDSVRRLSNRFGHRQDPRWKFSVRKVDDGFRCARVE